MFRSIFCAATLLLASATASATTPLTIKVTDEHGYAIPTATIRFSLEGYAHRVNGHTGRMTETNLYLDNREVLALEPAMTVRFQVNAPGYASQWRETTLHHVNNRIVIRLESMGQASICGSRPQSRKCRRAAADHSPSVVTPILDPNFTLTPDVLLALGDLRHADPVLSAQFSSHLLALGPDYADQAITWADHAKQEARVLSGPEYVNVIDKVYEVRAKAANVQWQATEYERLASEAPWMMTFETESARRKAAEIAGDWNAWADASGSDSDEAMALCLSASHSPTYCR